MYVCIRIPTKSIITMSMVSHRSGSAWEFEREFDSSASKPNTICDEESHYEDTILPRTEIQELYQAIVNSVTTLFMLPIAFRISAPRARYETSFSDSYDIEYIWETFPHARAKP